MARLCLSARITLCIALNICTGCAQTNRRPRRRNCTARTRRRIPSRVRPNDLHFLSPALVPGGAVSCAAGLDRGTAVQHSHAGLLSETDVIVYAPAQPVSAPSWSARQYAGGSARSRHAFLHLHGGAAF